MEISTFMRPHDDEQDLDISKIDTHYKHQEPKPVVDSPNPQESIEEQEDLLHQRVSERRNE